MGFRRAAVSFALRGVVNTLCKVDCSEYVDALSKNEPLIVIMNHTNFLEVPILVAHSYPIKVTGVAKTETWDNPIFAFLFNTYRAIPIDRRGAFQDVFNRVKAAIKNGSFVCLFPEGTRSKNGVLGEGKAGIILMAMEVGAPVLPVVHYGGERIWENMKRFRRTPFCFKAGRPFRINFKGRPDRAARAVILGEVMGQMSRLLPAEMRGSCTPYKEDECRYLEFL